MKEESKKMGLRLSINDVIDRLSDYCNEDEINDLKEEVNFVLEDGMEESSILYLISGLSNSNVIIKAKRMGIPVNEVFRECVLYCARYNKVIQDDCDDESYMKSNLKREIEEFDFYEDDFRHEFYEDEDYRDEGFVRTRDFN